ncbi:hypothetical protein JDV02_009306 [Purpureocillium takamizusanense]|uniref:Uncharacterized protein n=1 Tax=Purpureocillium takamizusanense TaxID=2060973 RepID=A0A9Q8QQD9_9HYPO|nr:uncharacterized protein JDV02_009306 [Purpureocillium takamizusanense]UNI23487.1 hypothetical protein JDV02_009306 [Purpureocillium takamizusanense]
MSFEALASEYDKMVDQYCAPRPDLVSFLKGGREFNGGFLIFRDSLLSGRFDGEQSDEWDPDENKLAQVLNTVDIGGLVSQSLFAQGARAVLSAATTSTQSWSALTHSAKIWDVFAGAFSTDGPASVFIATTPEYTIGEFRDLVTRDPYGLSTNESLAGWFEKAMTAEKHIYLSIQSLHTLLLKKPNHIPRLGRFSQDIVEYTLLLKDVKSLHLSNQFTSAPQLQLFRPSASFAILERCNTLKVLHFHKVPFLDRRLLAIILRACPKVEMLGVYECPLVHFGDIICLLDLIHEINLDRRADGQPTITALDLCPEFHGGMTSNNPHRAEAYGLSWAPMCVEIAQRGTFCLVLKAFMKAKAMKLGLLFSKEGALLSFLFKLPHQDLAMATFLDACHRLVDQHKRKSKGENAQMQLLYDLLKPVRVGLERVRNDWSRYYIERMGKSFCFCCSCGCEMVPEFFTSITRQNPAHARSCAGCLLQIKLDMDRGQLRPEKRGILDNLFPDWQMRTYNKDAPFAAASRSVIKLKTTESFRRPDQINSLIRDGKLPLDSLQNLPSLSGLLNGPGSKKPWLLARHEANGLDVYSRVLWRLRNECVTVNEKGNHYPRFDDRLPDHVHECQLPNHGTSFARCRSLADIQRMRNKGEREDGKASGWASYPAADDTGFW